MRPPEVENPSGCRGPLHDESEWLLQGVDSALHYSRNRLLWARLPPEPASVAFRAFVALWNRAKQRGILVLESFQLYEAARGQGSLQQYSRPKPPTTAGSSLGEPYDRPRPTENNSLRPGSESGSVLQLVRRAEAALPPALPVTRKQGTLPGTRFGSEIRRAIGASWVLDRQAASPPTAP